MDGVGSSEEIEDDRAGDYCDVVEACPTLARREQFGPYPVGGLEPVRRAACEDDGVNERSLVTEAEDVGAGSPGPAPADVNRDCGPLGEREYRGPCRPLLVLGRTDEYGVEIENQCGARRRQSGAQVAPAHLPAEARPHRSKPSTKVRVAARR